MRNIRMEKDIILYYNNPAGYVSGGKAVVDPLFQSEEHISQPPKGDRRGEVDERCV